MALDQVDADEIESGQKNMGFFEYSLCLYQAPECYGGIWALCALNYCMTGEQK